MKDYDYHRPAEKVLLDSYRKQNRNKNRLLFLAVALTVGVIFCMISFAYGKIQVDIQKLKCYNKVVTEVANKI